MPDTDNTQVDVKTDLMGITIRLLVSGIGVLVIVYAWTDLKVATPEERSKIVQGAGSVLTKAAKQTLPVAQQTISNYFKPQVK